EGCCGMTGREREGSNKRPQERAVTDIFEDLGPALTITHDGDVRKAVAIAVCHGQSAGGSLEFADRQPVESKRRGPAQEDVHAVVLAEEPAAAEGDGWVGSAVQVEVTDRQPTDITAEVKRQRGAGVGAVGEGAVPISAKHPERIAQFRIGIQTSDVDLVVTVEVSRDHVYRADAEVEGGRLNRILERPV